MDRLEELLAMLDDEDEDEEREDVPAMRDRTVPAAPEEDDGAIVPARDRRRGVPAGQDTGGPDRTAGERPEEDPRPTAADGGALLEAQAAWRRELAEKPDEAVEAVRTAAAEAAEAAGECLSAERGAELARVVRHGGESGLEELYRQTVQASRPAQQALPVEQAGRTLRAEEPGRTAALTVDELDRMVRRDSRRYDGGMTIF